MYKEMRITDEELLLIKSLYADNPSALKMLRKTFLPELDVNAPIGQNFNLWSTLDVDNLSPEAAYIEFQVMKKLTNAIENGLIRLTLLAGQKDETLEQTKERLSKNSSK